MNKKTPSTETYDVGYKKPPKATQFQKGNSGNPRGRPKGGRNLASLAKRVSDRKITIQENGRTRRISAGEAVLMKIFNKALAGDAPSQRLALSLLTTAQSDGALAPTLFQSDGDRALLRQALEEWSAAGEDEESIDAKL